MTLLAGETQHGRRLDREEVGRLLGSWQRRELLRARKFRECSGLDWEDLEDLYQDAALALVERDFVGPRHLRNALHHAIKQRALREHQKRVRRERIITEAIPGAQALAHASELDGPEQRVLAEQDRFIVAEFLTELSTLEQKVFKLQSEGHAWRAAATALGIDRDEGRRASRACEKKREQFATLYETGRLCGYRASTIEALKRGETDSAELAQRACAHLRSCGRCRLEHGTNGQCFRSLFDAQASALLPLPVLARPLALLTRLARYHQQLSAAQPSGASANLREQLATLAASGGVAVKLAAGAATVAVFAGGAVGANQLFEHGSPPARQAARIRPAAAARHAAASAVRATPSGTSRSAAGLPSISAGSRARAAPLAGRAGARGPVRAADGQVAPTGFAYLGVPRGPRRSYAESAAVSPGSSTRTAADAAPSASQQRGGGPFSP